MTDHLLKKDLNCWYFRSCEQVEGFNQDATAASLHTQCGGGKGDESNEAVQALMYLVEKIVLMTLLGRKECHKMVLSKYRSDKKLRFYTHQSEADWRASIKLLSKYQIKIQDPKTITNNRRSKNIKTIDSGINCTQYCEFIENWLGYNDMFKDILQKKKNIKVKSKNKSNNSNKKDDIDGDRLQMFKIIIDQFLRVKVSVASDDDSELDDVPIVA